MIEQQDGPSVDTIARVIMIDMDRKVKMTVQLRDEEGDEIPLKDTIEKLVEYISDKLKEEEINSTRQQIYPLMAQAMVGGLSKLLGSFYTSVILSNSTVRYSLIHMMTVGFYLLKFIQNKGIKIHTIEEPITADDIEAYQRLSKASDTITNTTLMGYDPKQVVQEMLKNGLLKHEDLEKLGIDGLINKEAKEDSSSGTNLN